MNRGTLCSLLHKGILFQVKFIRTTDGHPENAFFQKSQTFGLGQTNWAEKCSGIWGIFGRTSDFSTHLGTVSPLFMVLST